VAESVLLERDWRNEHERHEKLLALNEHGATPLEKMWRLASLLRPDMIFRRDSPDHADRGGSLWVCCCYTSGQRPQRVALDAFGDPAERDEINPFARLLWEKGTQFECVLAAAS